MRGDVLTLEPARNGREDGDFIGWRHDGCAIGLFTVAPHPACAERRLKPRSVSSTRLVKEVTHRRSLKDIGASPGGLPGRCKKTKDRHNRQIIE